MKSVCVRTSYLLLLLIILFATALPARATVEWSIQHTLKTDAIPLDMAISTDGRTLYVLTDDGKILIYDRNGNLKDTVPVGSHVSQIRIDPRGEQLFAVSRNNKTVEIITLDFIRPINTLGAPFKGPAQAPVVIAVFSDFQ
jgi:DNA-binding beta-propeller fold protein YncE